MRLSNLFKSLLILLFATYSYSAEEMLSKSYRNFTGGLNDSTAEIYMQDSESPDMLNMVIDRKLGALSIRKGYSKVSNYPTGKEVLNSTYFNSTSGARYLVATDGESIYATSDFNTWTKIKDGYDSDTVFHFDLVNTALWAVHSSTHAVYWDGSTTKILDGNLGTSDPPQCDYIKYWQNRVWLAKSTDSTSSVYFSNLVSTTSAILDPSVGDSVFSDLNQIYINRQDGSEISAIIPFKGYMFAFKETGIWRIEFNTETDLALSKSISNVGCISGDTIVEYDNSLVFLGKDGVYSFDGVNTTLISRNVTSTIEATKQPYQRVRAFNYSGSTFDTYSDISTVTINNALYLTREPIYENFTDGDLTDDPTWSKTGSDYFDISSISELNYTIPSGITSANGSIGNTEDSSATGVWQIKIGISALTSTTDKVRYYFIDNGISGYFFEVNHTTTTMSLGLYRFLYNTEVLISSASVTPTSTKITYTITRNSSGVFSITNNGGLASLSATDTTYTTNTGVRIYVYKTQTLSNTQSSIYIDNIITPRYYATILDGSDLEGYWISEAYNTNPNSQYLKFTASQSNTSTTDIYAKYYVRASSSTDTIDDKSWTEIEDGDDLSQSSTDYYLQIKVELSENVLPSYRIKVTNLGFTWVEGMLAKYRPTSFRYNNKYYMTVSTASASGSDTLLILSPYPKYHWTKHDIPCNNLTEVASSLYCSQVSTSSILKLETGFSDDNTEIPFYYTTANTVLGTPYLSKYISDLWLDYSFDTYPLTVSVSDDGGLTYTDKSFYTTYGLTKTRGIKRLLFNKGPSTMYKFKVAGSMKDTDFSLYGLDVVYKQGTAFTDGR